jgi:DNA-3-methyladenine glycosylase
MDRIDRATRPARVLDVAASVPMRLDREHFNRPTLRVARDLLGKVLVRGRGRRKLFGMITEVEAYKGPRDLASHAARGRRTARVEPLYCEGGTIYVYLVYGIHWLLNFSTAGEGNPEGVLIRGVLADPRGERRLLGGPGRVTQYLEIDKRLDGGDATTSTQLWIEDWGKRVPARSITTGPRVGVDYAGPYWAARPWRFRIDSAHAESLLER